jgi:hypothetical protein
VSARASAAQRAARGLGFLKPSADLVATFLHAFLGAGPDAPAKLGVAPLELVPPVARPPNRRLGVPERGLDGRELVRAAAEQRRNPRGRGADRGDMGIEGLRERVPRR